MHQRTIDTIHFLLADRPEGWSRRIAQALLDGGYTVASPEELGPIIAEELGGMDSDPDYDELASAVEDALSRSPVLADRAALALTTHGYDYPDDAELVAVEWADGQPALVIYADGSALVEPCEPWADWTDALVRLIEEAIEGEGQAILRIEPRWSTAEAATMADEARELARQYGATVEA